MICNNCGSEIEEGMKFCGECGAAVPQTKICVSCGAEIAIRMKFCPECGANQNPVEKLKKDKTVKTGMSLGDKNVIGGSIIEHKEDTLISGNATIIKNEDQSKQIKQCHICGSLVSIIEGFVCPECGRFTCKNCYNGDENCCIECIEKNSEQKNIRYKDVLNTFLADGKIDIEERKKLNLLQQELGLSPEKANQLEKEIRNNLVNKNKLTTFEKMNLKRAEELFYNEEKINEALNLIKPVYQSHKTEEEVLNLFLPILAEDSPKEAIKLIDDLQIDIISAYVTSIGIYFKQNNLIEAEKKLEQAFNIWEDNSILKCYRVLFNYAMYKQFNDVAFFEQAKKQLSQFKKTDNALELSYQTKVRDLLKEEIGENVTEYNKDFCVKNGLYYYIMSNNPLLTKEENEKIKKEKEVLRQKKIEEELNQKKEEEIKKTEESLSKLQEHILENKKEYSLEELKKVEEEFHNPEIQYYISGRYFKNEDFENCFLMAKKSAEQGYIPAQYMLGKMYYEGLGTIQNYYEAVIWYRKAAEKGDSTSQYKLGLMYYNGQAVKQDYTEAEKWLTKAAEQGEIGAQKTLENIKKETKKEIPNDFVFIEGGTFRMGSEFGDRDERPVHNVTVSSFYMCKHQVTQEEYKTIMGGNPSFDPFGKKPAEKISWYDAIEYCNKRSIKEGLTPAYKLNGNVDTIKWGDKGNLWDSVECDYSANGYRLPTEAEWEYAAGERFISRAFKYSGSNDINSVGWYSDNSQGYTHSVMTKKPNNLFLYDMSGNVYEWCWDWFETYDYKDQTNPKGPSFGSVKIIRGGCYMYSESECRITFRNNENPALRYNFIGFRVVRSDKTNLEK